LEILKIGRYFAKPAAVAVCCPGPDLTGGFRGTYTRATDVWGHPNIEILKKKNINFKNQILIY
jgi:hypothetical protein